MSKEKGPRPKAFPFPPPFNAAIRVTSPVESKINCQSMIHMPPARLFLEFLEFFHSVESSSGSSRLFSPCPAGGVALGPPCLRPTNHSKPHTVHDRHHSKVPINDFSLCPSETEHSPCNGLRHVPYHQRVVGLAGTHFHVGNDSVGTRIKPDDVSDRRRRPPGSRGNGR
jgi:hypothetical protein